MNSSETNQLPVPDRLWFGSLAGIAALILMCVIAMLVGPRACGAGTQVRGLTPAPLVATATATGTRSPGIIPSVTHIPSSTWTPRPGVTPPPLPPSDTPSSAIVCSPRAQFIADVTVPDGSVMAPGMSFTKTWRVANPSDCPWDNGSSINYAGGSQLGAPPTAPIQLANPGLTVDISIDMVAPDEPGEYRGVWVLQTPSGVAFAKLSVAIVVAVTPTPRPSISMDGARLSGIARDPVRGRLFVSGRDANAVFVIDEKSMQVEQRIEVGAQPFGVIYYNHFVYVANFGSDSISMIDASTLQVIRTFSVAEFGGEPTHLTVDPKSGMSGRIFVPVHRGGQLAAIDLYSTSISRWGDLTQWPKPDSGGGPYGIAAVPQMGRVLVSRRDRFDLVSVDSRVPVPGHNLNPAVSLEGSPYFVAVDQEGTRIYVTLSASSDSADQPNRLTVFNTSSVPNFTTAYPSSGRGNTVDVGYLGEAGGFIAIHPSDGTVWLSDAKTVQVWDRDLTQRLRWYGEPDRVGPSPYGIAINADLGRVYVVDSERNQVIQLNYP